LPGDRRTGHTGQYSGEANLLRSVHMKVVFINNYPMETAWERWKRGDDPANHLWGIADLPKYGVAVDILPYEKFPMLKKGLWRRFGYFGDIDQQLRILLRRSRYDVVYSACQTNTHLLAFLHSGGLFRKPLVAVLHHSPMAKTPRSQMFIDGHDKLLCLSQALKERLEERFHVPEGKLEVLHWGVDLSFYETARFSTDEPEFVLTAGKLMRDNDTLAKAFLEIDYPVFMACGKQCAPTIPGLPPHIRVRSHLVSIKELLNDYKKAYAVAIPIQIVPGSPPNYDGLTSLLEAMAVGKAVVMTRNDLIGIDIEKEGMGIWVEPGDVEGWRQAIAYLLAHPGETMKMGERAYRLCKEKYNLEMYSSRLAAILKDVVAQNR
jgi:glycosyltransferase involved in cell wall biosynthesis